MTGVFVFMDKNMLWRDEGMKKLCSLLLMLCLLCTAAFADGYSEWVKSRANGYVQFASYAGEYDGWVDIEGLGGVTQSEQVNVRVISKNASIWAEPRTNSKKLGSVSNGADLNAILMESEGQEGAAVLEQDGFYAVEYQGQQGWINSAYAVYAPFEIVLMESNVPAYSAPDRNSKRVGSLSKLTRYTVIGFYDDFYVVNLRQASAFVPMSVRHYDSHFERWYHGGLLHGKLTVRTKTAIRTGPGDAYAKVKDAKAGQVYDFIDEIDGWYLLSDGDDGGYTYIWTGDVDAEQY